MTDLERQLLGYRLTTAEIVYHFPDYPSLLQTFLWQKFDMVPGFPELNKFLNFWERHIEGKLHSVVVAHVGIISAAEWRNGIAFHLH